jgi:hypothetical protein
MKNSNQIQKPQNDEFFSQLAFSDFDYLKVLYEQNVQNIPKCLQFQTLNYKKRLLHLEECFECNEKEFCDDYYLI